MSTIFIANYSSYRREPRARRFAEASVKQGDRVVYLACREPGGPHRELINGVEVIAYPFRKKKPESIVKYILEYVLFFIIILWHLSTRPLRYDLIHICNMPDFLVFGAILPRILGVSVIHDVHDTMPDIYQHKFGVEEKHIAIRLLWYQLYLACRFASHVLVATSYQKRQLKALDIDDKKILVILNLPDESIFFKRKLLKKADAQSPFIVVYHGTLSHRLGLDIAIKAIKIVLNSLPGIVLRIIGDGEEREQLIRMCNELDISESVRFSNGYVPLERITEYLADADMAIIPMRDDLSTRVMLPTKLMEYALIGIPAIVTPTPLIMEYFDSSMVRFAVAENPNSFADAIMEMYHSEILRHNLMNNCHHKFTSIFRWENHKKEYLSMTRRLMNN